MKNQKTFPPLVVDIVVFTIEEGDLRVLLVKRTGSPFAGKWSLPGGFLKIGENPSQAALRILKEETGVRNVYLEQLYTFDSWGKDPRGWVVTAAYFALVAREKIKIREGKDDPKTPALLPVRRFPFLAFDHARIVRYARERLRYKLEYTNAVYSLLPPKFTLNQLQRTYEIVWGKNLDKRNFRKKFLALGLIKPTKEKIKGAPHRPARLYAFKKKRLTALKRFF